MLPIVHPPSLSERDLGEVGMRALYDLAELRGRPPRVQIVHLVKYALYHAIAGEDVELRSAQLARLQTEPLEPVA